MKRPPVLAPDHGCVRRGRCEAVRCSNGCGEYEHKKPAELPPECLRHDLAVAYVEGANCGPGLIHRLRNALASPSKMRGKDEGGGHQKPGPKIPLNADASDLLADITSPGRWVGADQDTLADWRRQARTILGFAVPSIALPDVHCFVCGQYTLRVARDADSDVWCSNAACHDDDKHPDCIDDRLGYLRELGYGVDYGEFRCRQTDKSLTHSHRWKRNSWAPIWLEMQAEKAAAEAVEAEAVAELEEVGV